MRWMALVVLVGVVSCTPSVRPPDVGSTTTPVDAGPTAPPPPQLPPAEPIGTPTRDAPVAPVVPAPVAGGENTAGEPTEAPLPAVSEAVPLPGSPEPRATIVPTDTAAAPPATLTPAPPPTVELPVEPPASLAEAVPPTPPPASDPATELVAALQAQAQASSFRVHETLSGPSGTLEYRIAYTAPDRFHLVGSDGSEAIVVGPDLYPRRPEGDWVLTPGAGRPIAARFIGLREPAMVEQFRQTIPNVTFRGAEVQEGMSTRVYHYTLVAEGAINARTETTVWVAEGHGRPVRVETTSTLSLPEETVTTSSVLRFSDYGAAIVIQPPF